MKNQARRRKSNFSIDFTLKLHLKLRSQFSIVYFVILNKFRIEIYRRICILIPFELGVINHRLNRACPLQREGRYKKQDPSDSFRQLSPATCLERFSKHWSFSLHDLTVAITVIAFGSIIMERFAISPWERFVLKLNVYTNIVDLFWNR